MLSLMTAPGDSNTCILTWGRLNASPTTKESIDTAVINTFATTRTFLVATSIRASSWSAVPSWYVVGTAPSGFVCRKYTSCTSAVKAAKTPEGPHLRGSYRYRYFGCVRLICTHRHCRDRVGNIVQKVIIIYCRKICVCVLAITNPCIRHAYMLINSVTRIFSIVSLSRVTACPFFLIHVIDK